MSLVNQHGYYLVCNFRISAIAHCIGLHLYSKLNFQMHVEKIYGPIARQVEMYKSPLETGVLCCYFFVCTVVTLYFTNTLYHL